jgi:hypothetical protein
VLRSKRYEITLSDDANQSPAAELFRSDGRVRCVDGALKLAPVPCGSSLGAVAASLLDIAKAAALVALTFV